MFELKRVEIKRDDEERGKGVKSYMLRKNVDYK